MKLFGLTAHVLASVLVFGVLTPILPVNAAPSTVTSPALFQNAAAAKVAPKNTKAPTISGTTRVPNQLTVANGSWKNRPTGFNYQWLRCSKKVTVSTTKTPKGCSAIGAATSAEYSLTQDDVGKFVVCRVIASNKKGSSRMHSAGKSKVLEAAKTVLFPGALTKVRGTGFRPFSSVRVEMHSDPVLLEEFIADGAGKVDEELAIPGDTPQGEHSLVLIGEDFGENPKTVEIPIDVFIPTSSMTSTISGRVTNSEGTGLPYVLVTSLTIDGASNASAMSDGQGYYSILAPIGLNTLSYEWFEFSETQRVADFYGLPASWKYQIGSIPIAGDKTLNVLLPETISVTIDIPNSTYSGYVTIDPGGVDRSISSTFEIAPGVTGSLSVGTVTGRYAAPGRPARFAYFPIDSAKRIVVEGHFFGTRAGDNRSNHYRLGNENVSLSRDTTVTIDPSMTTLDLRDSGTAAGANYAYIYSSSLSFEVNVNDLSNIHIPTNTPVAVEYGHIQYSSPSSNTFPDNWRAIVSDFATSGPTSIIFDLPPFNAINASFKVNGGTGFAVGTAGTSLKLIQQVDGYIPIDLDIGVQGRLINVAATEYFQNSQGPSRSYYFYNAPSIVSTIEISGSGSLDNNTFFSKTVVLDPETLTPGQALEVGMNVDTSDRINGQVVNSSGGVGRTVVNVWDSEEKSSAIGESQSDGSFNIPAPVGSNAVTIFGLSNIDSAKNLPKYWSLSIPSFTGLDLGIFSLPEVRNISIQVVGPLGLPIPNARVREIDAGNSNPIAITSSTGVVGNLYDGIRCPIASGCTLMNRFLYFSESGALTNLSGIATLKRFGTSSLGTLIIDLPGSGPNAATTLTVDSTQLIGGTAVITVPNRR